MINAKPLQRVIHAGKDGSIFCNERSITPVFNQAEQLAYFIGIKIGIEKDASAQVPTEQRVSEQQEQEQEQLQQPRAELAALKI